MIITDKHIAALAELSEDSRLGLMLFWLYDDDVFDDDLYDAVVARVEVLRMDAAPADDEAAAVVGGRS